MQKRKIFLLLAIFWLAIIGGFIAVKEYTLRTGQEVLLKTTVVDPRDLFRGDYVILRYDISTLDLKFIEADTIGFKLGDKVYVSLDVREKYAVASKIYGNSPRDSLYIKGTVKHLGGDGVGIEYGIESYFVPEGEGKVIERQVGRNVDVKVSIDKFGNAIIKSLLMDGQEVRFDS